MTAPEEQSKTQSFLEKEALLQFEKKLEHRINPERSRKFQKEEFIRRRDLLKELADTEAMKGSALRISVVGSNGKGSTAFFLSHMFEAFFSRAGSRGPASVGDKSAVGLYTSPHLLSVLERIRLNSIPIEATLADAACEELEKQFPSFTRDLSYFEFLTSLAVYIFARNHCPVEIYEAGLGGKLDATSMARADVVILTSIAQEHTELLGTNPEQIQAEKLGIISDHTKIVYLRDSSGILVDSAKKMIQTLNPNCTAKIFEAGQHDEGYIKENFEYARFIAMDLIEKNFKDSFDPSCNWKNTLLDLKPQTVPGRMERKVFLHSPHSPRTSNAIEVFFDTAHNPQAISRALRTMAGLREPEAAGSPELDVKSLNDSTLVVFALLKDRSCKDFLLEIRKHHTGKIIQIIGEPFASACTYSTIEYTGQWESLQKEILETPAMDRILIAGTHRIYPLFGYF